MTKLDVPFSITVGGSAMPEHMSVGFTTSGYEGGNGSLHELKILWGAGGIEPEILHAKNGAEIGVRLGVNGDWELEGLLNAFIALGDHLRLYRQSIEQGYPSISPLRAVKTNAA